MDNSDLQREKLKQVFDFLRELHKVKTPPISDVKQYAWKLSLKTLPSFPSIQVFNIESSSNAEGVILRVTRPKETNCPPPPKELKDWIEKGWDKLDGEVCVLPLKNFEDKDGKTFTEAFESDSSREESLQKWLNLRKEWQEAEKPVREAIKIYSDLFTLQGTFDRESEKYQLYIADGFFVTKSEFGEIHHPILLKKVEFSFDPSKLEFSIYDSEDAPELYSALLRFHELNGEAISDCKLKVTNDEIHPVGNGKTEEFLKYFISRFFRDGEYFSEKPGQIDKPYIYRSPTLILSTKSQGFAEAIENLIEAIPRMEVLPEALLRIIGIDSKVSLSSESNFPPEIPNAPSSNSSVDYLLTKPSNKEQERVIKKLEETGAVLVQGPPGTGKSHTIANILGHLLANGKRVLVSSHTSKALRVVREQVVEELRPLCISVLDNDHESKGQLEDSVNKIVNYHSKTDEKTLELEAEQLNVQRKKLKEKLQSLNDLALEIRRSEYEDIVLCGDSLDPSESARFVKENSDLLSIIPSPVTLGAPFPLSTDEVYKLYRSNNALSIEEELTLQSELPQVDDILKPSQVKELSQQATLLTSKDLNYGAEFWAHENQNEDQLQNTIQLITSAQRIFEAEPWLRECIEASLQNTKESFESPWVEFVRIVNDIHRQIRDHEVIESRHLPEPGPEATLELAIEIHTHLKNGGNLSSFSLMFRPSWKKFIQTSRVIDGQPKNIEQVESIVSHLQIKKLRRELFLRWERQVVSIGGQSLTVSSPERMAYSYAELISNAIQWQDSWDVIVELSTSQGLNYQKFYTRIKEDFSNLGPLAQLQRAAELLRELFEIRLKRVTYKQLNQKLEASLIQLHRANVNDNGKSIILNLEESLRELDSARYEEWFNVLVEISSKRPLFEMRSNLVKKIAKVSPMWAECLNSRTEPHNSINPPGDMVKAWKVRQLNDLILDRHKHDYVKIQEEIAHTKRQLETLTTNYVEKLAWRFQKKNTTQKSWQALQGWLLIQKRLSTTGQGKKDQVFLKEARKLIKEAKEAVPVWIMPLSKIIDNFDLGHSRFDVLILDEASQSDIMALIAFAIAKQVIVVGDNEQVTPYAVGMQVNQVQVLIDMYLKGIPNAVLYDGKTSIYDLAQQSFGETIRLVEHFRCVPDIIGYSNLLSYNGEIKPLRESSSSPYKRHTISHRVMGARENGKTNSEEAFEIASLIIAMINDPYYDLNDKNQKTSFGVVSLLGDEQAYLIESILRENLEPAVYKERRILCGNSSQFQGDERDVVFISLVDSPEDGPLRLKRTPEFKKICNVAVSRARNQLWVVHSLNPSTDLKDGDLRLQLIKYAENPKAAEVRINDAHAMAESPFEKSVQGDLIRNGFKISPQWRVGAYRIDMVAVGRNGKKIAIECDGEKYHSGDKMLDDLYRQTVLERLGWKFIRIRGSEYYRDPASCMNKVIARLEHYKIERIAGEEDKVESDFNEDQQEIIRKAYEIKESIKKKKEESAA